MKTYIVIVLAALGLLTTNSFAAGGLAKVNITKVAFQTGGFFLYSDNWNNPNDCSMDTAVVLLSTDSNYDKAYALLLAAYTAGKTVRGFSNGCTTFDGQTYNTIRGFKYLVVE